jgi:hypothetical protein
MPRAWRTSDRQGLDGRPRSLESRSQDRGRPKAIMASSFCLATPVFVPQAVEMEVRGRAIAPRDGYPAASMYAPQASFRAPQVGLGRPVGRGVSVHSRTAPSEDAETNPPRIRALTLQRSHHLREGIGR